MRKSFLSSDKEEVARASWEAFRESAGYGDLLRELGLPAGSVVAPSFIIGWHYGFVCAMVGIEVGAIRGVGPPTKPERN
jgi:hypothetical protein